MNEIVPAANAANAANAINAENKPAPDRIRMKVHPNKVDVFDQRWNDPAFANRRAAVERVFAMPAMAEAEAHDKRFDMDVHHAWIAVNRAVDEAKKEVIKAFVFEP